MIEDGRLTPGISMVRDYERRSRPMSRFMGWWVAPRMAILLSAFRTLQDWTFIWSRRRAAAWRRVAGLDLPANVIAFVVAFLSTLGPTVALPPRL